MKKTILYHMKKAALIAAAMILMASCALAQTAVISSPAGIVGVHAAPDQNAMALGNFFSGTQVEILGDAGNGWSQVAIGMGTGVMYGYAMTRDLAAGAQMNATYEASVASPYGTQSVVLRDAPSNSYHPVAMLMVGDRVLVIGQSGEFCYVQTVSGCVGCLLGSELK